MTTTINTARQVIEAHGFTLHGCAGHYVVRRDIPPFGSRCPKDKGFHRDYRGFHASDVSLGWVRRLADALALADAQQVTSCDCAEACAADRKAHRAWLEAGPANEPAERKAGGAAAVAQLIAQVLLEEWQIWHPISETIAAIDRGRQPLAGAY